MGHTTRRGVGREFEQQEDERTLLLERKALVDNEDPLEPEKYEYWDDYPRVKYVHLEVDIKFR